MPTKKAFLLLFLTAACGPAIDDPSDKNSPCLDKSIAYSGQLTVHDRGEPTAAEQLALELLNRARRDPAAEASRFQIDLAEGTNPPLAAGERPPLVFNQKLNQVAADHSKDMIERDFFDHDNPDGHDPFDRIQLGGYQFRAAGENLYLALGISEQAADAEVPVSHRELFVDSGIAGRGHRVNIVEGDFLEVGIGIETGSYLYNGSPMPAFVITHDYGSPMASVVGYLLGVVYSDDNGNDSYDPGEGLSGVRVKAIGDETVETVTGSAGGYAFAVHQGGTFGLVFSGGGLGEQMCQVKEVTAASVKADLAI